MTVGHDRGGGLCVEAAHVGAPPHAPVGRRRVATRPRFTPWREGRHHRARSCPASGRGFGVPPPPRRSPPEEPGRNAGLFTLRHSHRRHSHRRRATTTAARRSRRPTTRPSAALERRPRTASAPDPDRPKSLSLLLADNHQPARRRQRTTTPPIAPQDSAGIGSSRLSTKHVPAAGARSEPVPLLHPVERQQRGRRYRVHATRARRRSSRAPASRSSFRPCERASPAPAAGAGCGRQASALESSSRLVAVRSKRVRPWPSGLREAMLRAAAPGRFTSRSRASPARARACTCAAPGSTRYTVVSLAED